ncbi:hypothetical protein SH139x_001999 [Planctomycetaceae bacterium SH139]
MIILDTDHVSILQLENQPAEQLRGRLIEASDEWIGTTFITLVNDAFLLTANARDFEKVRGLRYRGWLS